MEGLRGLWRSLVLGDGWEGGVGAVLWERSVGLYVEVSWVAVSGCEAQGEGLVVGSDVGLGLWKIGLVVHG